MTERGEWITRLDEGSGGLRVAVKDLFDISGAPTTAGCRAVAVRATVASNDAACLKGLRSSVEDGTAVLVGKVNLHELADGITGINPWYGTPSNPLDPRRIPGGSSSASATTVASGEIDVAFGTDTAGSIRIPAACCGVAGLMTTPGWISREGVWPLSQSLDTVGPMASDIAGLVVGLALLERDLDEGERVERHLGESDPGERNFGDRAFGKGNPLERNPSGPDRLGLGELDGGRPDSGRPDSRQLDAGNGGADLFDGPVGRLRLCATDGSVIRPATYVDDAIDQALATANLDIVDIVVPGWINAARAALVIIGAESWQLNAALVRSDPDGIGKDVCNGLLRAARTGNQALIQARSTATTWRRRLEATIFDSCVAAVLPVLDGLPPRLDDRPEASMSVRWTAPVNLAGLPSLVLPVPLRRNDALITRSRLPTSLQLVGPPGSDRGLLALGARIEAAVATLRRRA